MARGRQKKRVIKTTREEAASASFPMAEGTGTGAVQASAARSSGPKWPLWLAGRTAGEKPEKASSETAFIIDTASAADPCSGLSEPAANADRVSAGINFENNPEELVLPPREESKNVRPRFAGVTNDATDMRKENQMQTATQVNPISDSEIATKIDLRDRKPVKEVSVKGDLENVAAGMASLFGPVIEDDVKGVRGQIREIIQSELQGELGQRFSRNLRIVIRREIAAAVDDQFDRV